MLQLGLEYIFLLQKDITPLESIFLPSVNKLQLTVIYSEISALISICLKLLYKLLHYHYGSSHKDLLC